MVPCGVSRMNLRIGIDMSVVDRMFQGVRTHVIELFSRVIARAPDIEFFVFLDQPELLPFLAPAFSAPNVRRIRMPTANPIKRLYWQLPTLVRRYDIDVIHTQYFLPAPVACARVVTIHDILFETHPQYFTPMFAAGSRLLMRYAARHADHVFTVSEFSKGEIARLYGVPGDRITVVYNGADLGRFAPGFAGGEFLLKRGLTSGNYILSVGRLEPRKNHRSLVEAYSRLHGEVPPLVLVGQRDFQFDAVFSAIDRLGLRGRVHVLEDVADDELPVLYRHAKLFAYPAFAEGFGMPPLEAMAAGVPVVSSNTTAIPEVVGDTGILVSPDDVSQLAAAMQRILDDPAEARRLAAAGRERALSFTWEAPAQKLHQHYLAALGKLKKESRS